jgi:hypothetical protein
MHTCFELKIWIISKVLRIDDKNKCHGRRLNMIWFWTCQQRFSEHWVKSKKWTKMLDKRTMKGSSNLHVMGVCWTGCMMESMSILNMENKNPTILSINWTIDNNIKHFIDKKTCHLVWNVTRCTTWKEIKGLLRLEIYGVMYMTYATKL